MSTHEIREMLLWSLGLNYAILLIWFGAFVYAHDAMYRMHARWFRLPVETFDAIHYGAMAVYKVGVILLNLVPLAALYLASRT